MNPTKRTKTMGLHEWSKNDTILTLYVSMYGTKNLYLKTEDAVAKFIGASLGSFKMQCMNIRALLGLENKTLSDFTKLQNEVFDEYKDKSHYVLYKDVINIINQDEYERIQCLKKLGKDPKKMKMVK